MRDRNANYGFHKQLNAKRGVSQPNENPVEHRLWEVNKLIEMHVPRRYAEAYGDKADSESDD